MDILPSSEWIERCARRIVQVDRHIADDEAKGLARELRHFERTAAMPPEAAVDFVATELERTAPRFERRAAPRA